MERPYAALLITLIAILALVLMSGATRRHSRAWLPRAPHTWLGADEGELLPPVHHDKDPGFLASVHNAPRQASYNWVQANPDHSLTENRRNSTLNRFLASEFEAAPWLLPTRAPALPYAGVHGFDKLLALRSRPAAGYDSSVALLLFSKAYAVMAQNSIYSLVKHGGVRNYLVLTGTPEDLEACADLNLPCADVADMLTEPLPSQDTVAQHGERTFLAINWLKAAALLRALQQDYVVMVADTDVAYAVKPVWESCLEFIEQAQADGAWQLEASGNTGHLVLLPTPASIAFAAAWSGSALGMIEAGLSEQDGLPLLEQEHIVSCSSLCDCFRADTNLTEQGRREDVALVRAYLPSHYHYTQRLCAASSEAWMRPLDPCDGSVILVHANRCSDTTSSKRQILSNAGFWFVDDSQGEAGCQPQPRSSSGVPACPPLQWRLPHAEAAHYSCAKFEMGLVHGSEPASGATLNSRALWQSAADGGPAAQGLGSRDVSRKECE